MAGGAKKKHFNKSKSRSKAPSNSSAGSVFVSGGSLVDWSPNLHSTPNSIPGRKNPNGNARSGNSGASGASGSRYGPGKYTGNAYRYTYPAATPQDDMHPESYVGGSNGDNYLNASQPIVLVDSKETQIVAFEDKTPCSKTFSENFTYDYGSDLVLGDSSCRGLGFVDESEMASGGNGTSTKKIEEGEGSCFKLSSPEKDADADENNICKLGVEMAEEVVNTPSSIGASTKKMEEGGSCFKSSSLEKDMDADELGAEMAEDVFSGAFSSEKNSGFLSIGGMKLYTQDISDQESDEEIDGESLDEESSESLEPEDSVSSSDTSDSDSDIDEEVAKDYLEGIGGSDEVVDVKWLVEQDLDVSDDDGSSSNGFDDTIEKLGGIALQDASRDYGMKKPRSRKKATPKTGVAAGDWSMALDDLMYLKDPRKISAKKKHVAKLPQSWPSEAQKSKNFGNFPGAKKKHRKEKIALKRQERMVRRGVDLKEINLKLKQIVLDEVDIFAFQAMLPKDCLQVQRLASIYGLRSSSKGSRKKSFVTVTRTQDTHMPTPADKLRLDQMIGAADEDASRSKSSKSPASHHGSGKKGSSYARQPVSFISSGIMQCEAVQMETTGSIEVDNTYHENKGGASSTKLGAFEVHTKGFGSRMMAKMGFVAGQGLGKDGQGMVKPIEVTKRPKSLGLGVEFS
ncbi:hypothetical protein PVL29_014490 [Vitis rotundifolia]|uniref:G-patch domain-containing protein n=2 Tax=Vitis rotundifolia TaxID=103349 RepID=A0AA39DM19_VITRO|nr:hypothetical protein PVL29_014490 [Vitis rotundifolia]